MINITEVRLEALVSINPPKYQRISVFTSFGIKLAN
jgi:hypothetical protein